MLLHEGRKEPEFYGDVVYKFKKIIERNDFSFQFRKIRTRYRRKGYNLNVMQQSACMLGTSFFTRLTMCFLGISFLVSFKFFPTPQFVESLPTCTVLLIFMYA